MDHDVNLFDSSKKLANCGSCSTIVTRDFDDNDDTFDIIFKFFLLFKYTSFQLTYDDFQRIPSHITLYYYSTLNKMNVN